MAPASQRAGARTCAMAALSAGVLFLSPAFVPASYTAARSGFMVATPVASSKPGAASGLSGQQQASGCTAPVVGVAVLAVAAFCFRRSASPAGAWKEKSSRVVRCARGGAAEAPLVVIAGPPAAGKGTQCEKIKEKYGYVHISTGDMLRENVKNGTELGKKAEGYMKAGALVPSELLVDIVKERLAQADVKARGCLLDGFPRAPDQAQAMVAAGLKVEKFLLIEVPDEELVVRGCGRRLDPETGDIYHLKFKPPPAEIVDRLVHRSDDQEEAIRNRLKIYHTQVNGILPFFKDVVTEIDGAGKPDDVFSLVASSLDSLKEPVLAPAAGMFYFVGIH